MGHESSFLDTLFNIGSFLSKLIVSAFWGLYMIFSYIFSFIADLIKRIKLPVFPTASRVMSENVISGGLLIVFILYIICINISAFNLFRKDKILAIEASKLAEENEEEGEELERIPEKKLLKRCFLGGALGGYLAIHILRHKTSKFMFSVGVTVMLILQILIFSFVIGYFGFWLYFA